jgi:hypothetical protein
MDHRMTGHCRQESKSSPRGIVSLLASAAIAAALPILSAQTTFGQEPLARRTELAGTAPAPSQLFKVFQFPADKIPPHPRRSDRLGNGPGELLHRPRADA